MVDSNLEEAIDELVLADVCHGWIINTDLWPDESLAHSGLRFLTKSQLPEGAAAKLKAAGFAPGPKLENGIHDGMLRIQANALAMHGVLFPPLGATPSLRMQALALYTAPFQYRCGLIFDANGNTVADDPDAIARVRGWGRIQKVGADAGDLQDTVGELIALALTAYWEEHNG